VYDTVVVALDAGRHLNNGEPSGLAAWLDALDVGRGIRFLHIGCGAGYYTAVVAHAASPQGVVLALEADPELTDPAQKNLVDYVNVEVRCATSPTSANGHFDAVFVNAGATEILPSWLDRLAEGGRLLVPLNTTRSVNGVGGGQIGVGHMLRVERRRDSYLARFVSSMVNRSCGPRISGATRNEVKSLRRDRHEESIELSLRDAAHLHRGSALVQSDEACLRLTEDRRRAKPGRPVLAVRATTAGDLAAVGAILATAILATHDEDPLKRKVTSQFGLP